MKLGILALDQRSGERLARLLARIEIEAEIIDDQVDYSHIIIIGKSTDQILPVWITKGRSKVLGIGGGMEMIAKTFGSTSRETREKGEILTNEIVGKKQKLKRRWVKRTKLITKINDRFHITGVDRDNNVISFSDFKRWTGCQYRPDRDDYIDLALFSNFYQHRPRKK